jgi:hypothetical protein
MPRSAVHRSLNSPAIAYLLGRGKEQSHVSKSGSVLGAFEAEPRVQIGQGYTMYGGTERAT